MQLAGQLERVAQPLGVDPDGVDTLDDQESAGVGDRHGQRARAIDHAPGQAAALPARQPAMTAVRGTIEAAHLIGEPGQETPRPPGVAGLAQTLECRAAPLHQVRPQRDDGRRRRVAGAGVHGA